MPSAERKKKKEVETKFTQSHIQLICISQTNTQTEEQILCLMHKSTRIITLWKAGWWGASPSLPKNPGECASVRKMSSLTKEKLSWCAISGARKCRSRNITNQIISLRCHSASFTQSWDVNRIQWERALPSASQWVAMITALDVLDVWCLEKKPNSGHQKGAAYWLSPSWGQLWRSLSTL